VSALKEPGRVLIRSRERAQTVALKRNISYLKLKEDAPIKRLNKMNGIEGWAERAIEFSWKKKVSGYGQNCIVFLIKKKK